jgi:hypothetical protein
MRHLFIILFSFLFITSFCVAQVDKNKELRLAEFKFESIFGSTNAEPKSTYCLLGTGFFRTPRSEDSDILLLNWIRKHPKASVIPVSSFGSVEIDEPDSKMVYCWIVDQNDTLNNYLVKNGCFPGGTMMRPKTWDEMEKREKEFYEDSNEKPDVRVFVNKDIYDKFIEQIKSAELYASKNKLGIWKE